MKQHATTLDRADFARVHSAGEPLPDTLIVDKLVEAPDRGPGHLLRLTNVLGFTALVVINIVAASSDRGNKDISNQFHTPLTPAGYAFSIWGVIWALQGIAVVVQAMPQGYEGAGAWKPYIVRRIGYRWQLGWFAETAWQLSFMQESSAGMWVCMFLLFAAFAAFYLTLVQLKGSTHWARARGLPAGMPAEAYILFKLPTSINAAWLSVASCLGILVVPVSYGVPQSKLVPAAVVMAVLLALFAAYRAVWERDVAFVLTMVWAFIAVGSTSSVPTAVRAPALVFAGLLFVLTMFAVLRLRQVQRGQLSRSGSWSVEASSVSVATSPASAVMRGILGVAGGGAGAGGVPGRGGSADGAGGIGVGGVSPADLEAQQQHAALLPIMERESIRSHVTDDTDGGSSRGRAANGGGLRAANGVVDESGSVTSFTHWVGR